MNDLIKSTNPGQTMSSREIAELTGKEHYNVLRDIDKLISELNSDLRAGFESTTYADTNGKQQRMFKLDEDASILLVTGYDVNARMRIIRRWKELESNTAPVQYRSAISNNTPSGRTIAVAILRDELEASSLLCVPVHFAQIEAVKLVRAETGVDYANLLALAPAQNNINPSEELLEPTELGKRLGISARAANSLLAAKGYQEKVGDSWMPTDLGKSFATKHAWSKGTKSGYNLKWSVAVVDVLKEFV